MRGVDILAAGGTALHLLSSMTISRSNSVLLHVFAVRKNAGKRHLVKSVKQICKTRGTRSPLPALLQKHFVERQRPVKLPMSCKKCRRKIQVSPAAAPANYFFQEFCVSKIAAERQFHSAVQIAFLPSITYCSSPFHCKNLRRCVYICS